ncbi:MAG: hypothetical protein ABR570_02255 [Burkholderiales bacterium]
MAEGLEPKISQHYRALEALEPSRELDNGVLTVARRMSAPPARRRWYYSLAAAAVVVFAVALTWHLEPGHREPDVGTPLRLERELRGAVTPGPAYESKAPASAAARPEANDARPAEAARLDAATRLRAAAPEKPEPWLERIAELRSRGRHAEADKELAEFRRAFPEYRLSAAMRERVERK